MIEANERLILFVEIMLAALVGLPVLVYFCVKLGTVAFYSGRSFSRRSRKENVENGKGR